MPGSMALRGVLVCRHDHIRVLEQGLANVWVDRNAPPPAEWTRRGYPAHNPRAMTASSRQGKKEREIGKGKGSSKKKGK
eukprot:363966-Chlamydomonas_euryale.AAC.7